MNWQSDDAVGSIFSAPRGRFPKYRDWLRGRRFRALLWMLAILPPMLLFLLFGRWGLPSRANDDLLFGGDAAWSVERLNAGRLDAARRARVGGADTDLDPVSDRAGMVDLTATDADRAAILVRYRLYTHQPDEMITLMALARMNPRAGDFDPRLYQYGGLWIYFAGAALVAMKPVLGLQFSLAANLDQPDSFAWFYVVLRGITMLFAIGLIAVCQRLLVQLGARGAALAVGPVLLFTPVFINGTLEAKPHLPSACMTLLACAAAITFLRRPSVRRAVSLSLASGASMGLVLTGAASGALWPALLVANRRRLSAAWVLMLLAAGFGALLVYSMTNPYPLYNWLFRPETLASNVANSTAMYRVGEFGAGAARVAELMVEACGWVWLVVGGFGIIWLARRRPREVFVWTSPIIAMALLTIAIGAGKPAEFGRFLLLPSCAIAIGAAYVIEQTWRYGATVLLAIAILFPISGWQAYARAYWNDNGQHGARRAAGEIINATHLRFVETVNDGAREVVIDRPELRDFFEYRFGSVAVIQEPAPYSIPPIDFTRWHVLLLPLARPADVNELRLPQCLVLTADDEQAYPNAWWRDFYEPQFEFPRRGHARARITWANKPVFVFQLRGDQSKPSETIKSR